MRKIACIFCCIMLLTLLCACGNKNEEFQSPVNFYYVNKDISYNSPTSVICTEVREGISFYGNLTVFLRAYLDGPKSSDLQTYIPTGTELLSCVVSGNAATLTFSEEFSKLNGSRLSVASGALLLSANDFANINTIVIRVENGRWDEKDELCMSMDELVLMDSVPISE